MTYTDLLPMRPNETSVEFELKHQKRQIIVGTNVICKMSVVSLRLPLAPFTTWFNFNPNMYK